MQWLWCPASDMGFAVDYLVEHYETGSLFLFSKDGDRRPFLSFSQEGHRRPCSISPTLEMLNKLNQCHGLDFSGYSQISGFRYLSERNKTGVEMHFECDFSPFRIQTLTRSHPSNKQQQRLRRKRTNSVEQINTVIRHGNLQPVV